MRFVQKSRQDRDPDTDTFRGLATTAFMLGEKDSGGMSVTWIEHFGSYGTKAKRDAAVAFRESLDSKRLGPSAVFATAKVRSVLEAEDAFEKSLRVVYDPVPGNPGHAEVRHFDDSDFELLQHLAVDIFTEIDSVGALNLPKHT